LRRFQREQTWATTAKSARFRSSLGSAQRGATAESALNRPLSPNHNHPNMHWCSQEVKDHEARVGLLPSGAKALVEAGHQVLAQAGAGSPVRCGRRLSRRGSRIVATAAELWKRSDLVVRSRNLRCLSMRTSPGLILFTYLHLAPLPELTDKLLETRVNSVAYETIREATIRCRC